MTQGRPLRRAVRTGARRAGLHMLRAGYEVVAGVGAFLDEVVRARKEPPTPPVSDRPTRISVE